MWANTGSGITVTVIISDRKFRKLKCFLRYKMGNALATTSGSSAYNEWGYMKYNTRLMHGLADLAL